ncbi:MAG: transglutaminase family protein [Chthoniobacteraceae bacterium]|jgi:transglutaminase-like putative cysteine protease
MPMNFTVKHTSLYSYSKPVSLQPHIIRLRPRCDGTVRLVRLETEIEPEPITLSECLDIEGNSVLHAWFGDPTPRLAIQTSFEVETARGNPFDYLLAAAADTLPIVYGDELNRSLAGYLQRVHDEDTVANFGRLIAETAGGRTLEFLNALNSEIYKTCPISIRETGAPHPPAHTLEHRYGSCRDVAMLFIDACRAVGIAARFVSGYRPASTGRQRRYMHAWPEVYLPGGGWRGYDPTHDMAVNDEYIAVAACREPLGATPIEGGFRGTGATSTLEANIEFH